MLLVAAVGLQAANPVLAQSVSREPYVVVLGTAQDAGYPQA